jgi:site-specific recombinase XerD
MDNKLTVTTPAEIIQGIDFDQAITLWHDAMDLRTRTGELAQPTVTSYKKGMQKFTDWMQAEQPASISPDTIRLWQAHMLEANQKRSVNTWLAGVRSFFAWCTDARLIPYNPTATVKGASRKGETQIHRKNPLTNAEVRRLLAMPDTSTAQGARDFAILNLFLFTAMRSVEINRANLSDWQTIGTQQVIYYQGKGHSEADDYKVVVDPVADAVQLWLSYRGNKPGPLFTSLSDRSQGERLSLRAIRNLIKDHMRKAGIDDPKKTTHSLRHTAITNAIVNGAPLRVVQTLAGHASANTTSIYIHNVDRLQNPGEKFIDYSNHNGNGDTTPS